MYLEGNSSEHVGLDLFEAAERLGFSFLGLSRRILAYLGVSDFSVARFQSEQRVSVQT